jgi:hypothetical protein
VHRPGLASLGRAESAHGPRSGQTGARNAPAARLIQLFTTESPTLDAGQVLAAIVKLRASDTDAGFVVCDAVTGARLGNIALRHDGQCGEVSYWVAAEGRGRRVATRTLALFST